MAIHVRLAVAILSLAVGNMILAALLARVVRRLRRIEEDLAVEELETRALEVKVRSLADRELALIRRDEPANAGWTRRRPSGRAS